MKSFASGFIDKYNLSLFKRYRHIIMDYNFSPNGYNSTWSGFFKDVLPHLGTAGILRKNGSIWLPCWQQTIEILASDPLIQENFHVHWCEKTHHPLWQASEKAKIQLQANGVSTFTNELPIIQDGFLRLISKADPDINDAFIQLAKFTGGNHEATKSIHEILKIGPQFDHKRKLKELKIENFEHGDATKPGTSGTFRVAEDGLILHHESKICSPSAMKLGTFGKFSIEEDQGLIFKYVEDLVSDDDTILGDNLDWGSETEFL
jgi:hypothetical protein